MVQMSYAALLYIYVAQISNIMTSIERDTTKNFDCSNMLCLKINGLVNLTFRVCSDLLNCFLLSEI
jgi:hypothetical protein